MSSTRGDDALTGSWGRGAATWSLLVHGGAGDVSDDRVKLHVEGCERAAAEGAKVLATGGSALDAVQRAVEVLEDDPLFNAGTGACLDESGHIALDASLMEGTSLRAGAVCVLPAFKHPIAIARRVMDASPHVLLAAEGAVRFATEQGFAPADEASMITDAAKARLEAARAKGAPASWAGGTVGAVARDASGHTAAATSTGGMVGKRVGRVGDSPIIGAGTYADDEAGACSTTGHGEAMIRVGVARTVIEHLRAPASLAPVSPEDAVRASLARMIHKTSETGGAIVVARDGALGLARTTRTMTWAAVSDGETFSGS